MRHKGRCHCGAIRLEFETDKTLAPRACQCGFCRRHGARTVSDPAGSAMLTLGGEVMRYRFASKAADYVLCATCGVYAGAVTRIEGRTLATLNLNVFDDPRPDFEAVAVSYDGEGVEAKAERRLARWTPLRFT